MNKKNVIILLKIIVGLVILQFCRVLWKEFIFLFIKKTDNADHMVNALFMSLFTFLFIQWVRNKKVNLSVLPKRHKRLYAIITVFAFTLLISTPFITKDQSISSISLLIYSSIIIPMFEELLFRGFLWNQWEEQLRKTLPTYIITTIIFAIWHLGYMDAIWFRMSLYGTTGFANIMFWKVITGLIFGIILGGVRCKTKNCFSTILLHGIMNLFAR